MTGLILAWLTGEGIMCYRLIQQEHRPPLPADLLGTSGLFLLLAALAEAQPTLAALLAWGLDLASLLNLWPLSKSANASPKVTGGGKSAPVTVV